MQFNITKTIEENKNTVDTKFIYNKTFKRFEEKIGEDWTVSSTVLKKIISEPTGFALLNNETDIYSSVISFSVDGTRILSISPTNEHFIFYIDGKQFIKTNINQVQIPDIQGLHYVYFNENGILESTTDFILQDIMKKYASVATVYWDYVNKKAIYIGDKRHSINTDAYQNYINFINDQTVDYLEGTNIKFTNNTDGSVNDKVDGDGSSNYHTSFAIESGKYKNYDLINDSEHIEFNENIPIFYKQTINEEKNWIAMANKPDGSIIVAITNEGEYRLMVSLDQGETWDRAYLSFYASWTDIIYAQNKFIAIADSGQHLAISSTDGFNWTILTIPQQNKWQSITYGNGLFVVVGLNGTNRIMTSTNGNLWLTRNIPKNLPLKKVKFIPAFEEESAKFIAVSEEDITKIVDNTSTVDVKISSKAFMSEDGITWIDYNISQEKNWTSIVFANSRFVGVANTGYNKLLNTTDNSTWPTYELSTQEFDFQKWESVTFFNPYFIAVSSDGAKRFIRSQNGTNWESFASIGENPWKKIVASTSTLVAISSPNITNDNTNRLKYSSDIGETWSNITLHDNKRLEDIIYGERWLLIASDAATGGRISTSQNLTSWSNNVTRDTVYWRSAAYGNNRYVVVGEEDTSWKIVPPATSLSWESVTFGMVTATTTNFFVAVAANGTPSEKVMTSQDGLSWISRTGHNGTWQEVTYGLVNNVGRFVAVASSGDSQVMYSTDTVTWISANAAEANEWQSVTYGNNTFVAVASSGTNRVMYSSDGIDWTAVSVPDKKWTYITYGNGIFVALATDVIADDQSIMTSVDGITWSLKTTPISGFWTAATFGAGILVCVGVGGTIIASASNGDTGSWSVKTPTYPQNNSEPFLTNIVYQNGKFVAISGGSLIITSEDAENWEFINVTSSVWNGLTYGSNIFVSVARDIGDPLLTARVMTDFVDNNKIIYSSDNGTTWLNSTISVNKNWKKVKYLTNNENSGFYILSTDNKVYYSVNGQNDWTLVNISNLGDFNFTDFISANLFLVFITDKNKIVITGTNISDPDFTDSISVLNIVDNLNLNDIEVSDDGQIVIAAKPNKIIGSLDNGQNWSIRNLTNMSISKIRYFNNNFFVLGNSNTNRVAYFDQIDNEEYTYFSQNTLPYSFVDMFFTTYYLFLVNTGTQRIIKATNFIEVAQNELLLQFKDTIKDIYNAWVRSDNLNNNEIIKNRCLIVNQKINYNKIDNGFYRLEVCNNNKFYLYHVFMINDKDIKYAIFIGNQEYSSKEEAKNNILNEVNKLNGLPFNDFLPLGTIIYEVNDQYLNSAKARIVNINSNNYFKLIKKDLVSVNSVQLNKKDNGSQILNNTDLINLYGNKILEYALNKIQNLTSRDIDYFITRKEITLTKNGGIDTVLNIFGVELSGSYEIFDKNNPDTNMFFFLKYETGIEPIINVTSFSNLIIPSTEKGQTEAVLGIYIDSENHVTFKNFSDQDINLVLYRKT